MSITEQMKTLWTEMRDEHPVAGLLLALSVALPLLNALIPPLWPFLLGTLALAGNLSALAMFIVLAKPFINAYKNTIQ